MGAFDQAQAQTDAANKAALAALARGGSAGLADHRAAMAQLAAQRQAAVTAALQRAVAINAPEAGADLAAHGSMAGLKEAPLVPSAGGIYDRYAADQQRAATARDQAMADASKAYGNYFSEVNAARPIAEAAAAAARAKATQEDNLGKFISSFGGVGVLGNLLSQQAAGLPKPQRGEYVDTRPEETATARSLGLNVPTVQPGTATFTNVIRRRGATPEEAAGDMTSAEDLVGQRLGLPPGVGPAVVGQQATKPQTPSQQYSNTTAQAKLDRLQVFNTAKRAASPATFAEFQKALNPDLNGGVDPVTYVQGLKDSDLKKRGISRASLLDWVTRYSAI